MLTCDFIAKLRKCLFLGSAFVLLVVSANQVLCQSAAQLLKTGSAIQASDDTSDRATDVYRQLIRKYPRSAQAESAQFFLGGYYHRKFFILDKSNNVQDWGSLNRAEEELYTYLDKYPRGFYFADSYNLLAIIALRRGYKDKARELWRKMQESQGRDPRIYIFRVTWSSGTDDVVKAYCDTTALARVSLQTLDTESSFQAVVEDLTKWARSSCR